MVHLNAGTNRDRPSATLGGPLSADHSASGAALALTAIGLVVWVVAGRAISLWYDYKGIDRMPATTPALAPSGSAGGT